jgi:hypothetical protein
MKTLSEYTAEYLAKKPAIPKPYSKAWHELSNLASELDCAFNSMWWNEEYKLGADETEATKEEYESAYIKAMYYLTAILERLDGAK